MKTFRQKLWRGFSITLALLLLVFVVFAAHPVFHIARAIWNDRDDIAPSKPGTANDVSRLNETRVAEVWKIPGDQKSATAQLAELLQRARTNHLKVSIAGARHSMGGHTIYPDGIVVDMLRFRRMELDETNSILHVQAGARWSEVIPFLNTRGFSVEVMQSNDDFSIGGSLSVNCHGWQFNRPPIASTVRDFRLMLADGKIIRCNRMENRELFSLVLGGYGLFGIILDVDLHVVPNRHYKNERLVVSTPDYAATLANATTPGDDIEMVYGRLRVTANHFLQEGILNIFHREPNAERVVTALAARKHRTLGRAIFRGSIGSDYGKQLRWNAERNCYPILFGEEFDRNALLDEPAEWFQEHSANRTDILMECFVPPQEFEPFLKELRQIIPTNKVDLLNLTVRHIQRDDDTFLRFADKEMFALVMLFNQPRTVQGDADMACAAREIISAALRHAGSYYLPYRLHATPEQFVLAYPQAKTFFELKRKYDPEELFQNEFYRSYGK